MLDFMRLFAPHISAEQLESTRQAHCQEDIDALFDETALPLKTGGGDITAAA